MKNKNKSAGAIQDTFSFQLLALGLEASLYALPSIDGINKRA
jgi:hypothetical protein